MAETKKTTATKKTTTTTKKATTKKVKEPIVEEVQTETQPTLDLSSISPEVLAQLKAVLLADVKKELEEENKVETAKTEPVKSEENQYTKAYLKRIQDDEYIQVKSLYDGELNFSVFNNTSKEIRFRWEEKGSIETMTIREAISIEMSSKRFFHEPWLLPMDERFQVAYGLQDAVEVAEATEDLQEFCALDEAEIRRLVGKMNNGFKFNFRNEIAIAITFGKIKDYDKVRLLSELFNIRQDDLIEKQYKELI